VERKEIREEIEKESKREFGDSTPREGGNSVETNPDTDDHRDICNSSRRETGQEGGKKEPRGLGQTS